MAAIDTDSVSTDNPLDMVEEFVASNQWHFNRFDPDEMVVEAQGQWCAYRLYFLWREDLNALYFSAQFDLTVPPDKRLAAYELLARVNEKLWMGHFEMSHDDFSLSFRQTCLLRGQTDASAEPIEDLVDITLSECDRFYPAFLYMLQQGQAAEQALSLSLVDVAGAA